MKICVENIEKEKVQRSQNYDYNKNNNKLLYNIYTMYKENLVETNVAQYKFYLFGVIAEISRKVRKEDKKL